MQYNRSQRFVELLTVASLVTRRPGARSLALLDQLNRHQLLTSVSAGGAPSKFNTPNRMTTRLMQFATDGHLANVT